MTDHDDNGLAPGATPGRNRLGIVLLTSHWLSWLGLVVVITVISTWLFFLPAETQGHADNIPMMQLRPRVFLRNFQPHLVHQVDVLRP